MHPAVRRIPHEYLRGTKQFLGSALPDSPLLVFINSRSGGRAGTRLAEVLCHAIGHSQVPKCTSPSRPLHSMLVARRSQRAHRPAGGLRHALRCCELQVPGIGTCALCGQRIAIVSSCIHMSTNRKTLLGIWQHMAAPGWLRCGCLCLQVYDLQDHRPGPVLKAIFSNLDAAAAAGDTQVQLRTVHVMRD